MTAHLQCTIRALDDHGARAVAADEDVLLPAHELAWDPSERVRAVAVGDTREALVIGRGGALVFGSLKRAASQDPWQNPERYQVGDEVYGVVFATAAPDAAFAHLPGGAIARIADAAPAADQTVKLTLTAVDPLARRIDARIG